LLHEIGNVTKDEAALEDALGLPPRQCGLRRGDSVADVFFGGCPVRGNYLAWVSRVQALLFTKLASLSVPVDEVLQVSRFCVSHPALPPHRRVRH
jgi:hypothetical protein